MARHDREFFDGEDYSGQCPYVANCVTGLYTPANRDHPAYSPPAPNRGFLFVTNRYTSAELLQQYRYYYSCQNYLLLSSETRFLKEEAVIQDMFFPDIQDLFEEGKGWVITPNQQILNMYFLEPQPRMINQEERITEWNVRFDIIPEAKVYRKDTGQLYPISDFDTRGLIRDGAIYGTFRSRPASSKHEQDEHRFIPENTKN